MLSDYYGGSGNFDPRLIVQATEADLSGPAVVTFYVNGVKADQQVSYVPGSSSVLESDNWFRCHTDPTTQPTTTTDNPGYNNGGANDNYRSTDYHYHCTNVNNGGPNQSG